jgi:hypothetical protein
MMLGVLSEKLVAKLRHMEEGGMNFFFKSLHQSRPFADTNYYIAKKSNLEKYGRQFHFMTYKMEQSSASLTFSVPIKNLKFRSHVAVFIVTSCDKSKRIFDEKLAME